MVLTSVPAAETAYQYVRELVLDDRLPGGTMISEGEIAGQLVLSRTPVREAFLRLEAEGWLRLYPKRGALVVPIAAGEAQSVVDARLLVEVHAVESLPDSESRARLVATLGASVAQQAAALDRGDLAEYSSLDSGFHLAIVAAGGNPLLTSFSVTLRERQQRMVARSLWRDVERARGFVVGHERLTDFIRDGDPRGFAGALRRHLHDAHLPERAAAAGQPA
ncbi:MAG: GntR family transcriptional regulator [Cellulomonas sp.]